MDARIKVGMRFDINDTSFQFITFFMSYAIEANTTLSVLTTIIGLFMFNMFNAMYNVM
jgi:hypothetical protein